jgi:superfamily II DNA or RNA helicase
MSLTVYAYEVEYEVNMAGCSDIDLGEANNERSTKDTDLPIQTVFQALAQDQARTELLVNHAIAQFGHGRKVLLLTERTDHLLALQAMIQAKLQGPPQIAVEPAFFILHGRLKKSERHAIMERLQSLPPDQPRILLATGKLIGEGFDHAPLDTLILGMPISWKGTLQQYVGRLHREHAGKTDIVVIDFIDRSHPSLSRMWNKRLAGYKALGYQVQRIGHELGEQAKLDGCDKLEQDQKFQHGNQGTLNI